MPVFIAALIGGLISAAASMVGRVLIALGIGYVTYQGFDLLLSGIQAEVQANFAASSPTALAVFKLLKIDVSISIIFSAVATRLLIGGISAGKVTKAVIK